MQAENTQHQMDITWAAQMLEKYTLTDRFWEKAVIFRTDAIHTTYDSSVTTASLIGLSENFL